MRRGILRNTTKYARNRLFTGFMSPQSNNTPQLSYTAVGGSSTQFTSLPVRRSIIIQPSYTKLKGHNGLIPPSGKATPLLSLRSRTLRAPSSKRAMSSNIPPSGPTDHVPPPNSKVVSPTSSKQPDVDVVYTAPTPLDIQRHLLALEQEEIQLKKNKKIRFRRRIIVSLALCALGTVFGSFIVSNNFIFQSFVDQIVYRFTVLWRGTQSINPFLYNSTIKKEYQGHYESDSTILQLFDDLGEIVSIGSVPYTLENDVNILQRAILRQTYYALDTIRSLHVHALDMSAILQDEVIPTHNKLLRGGDQTATIYNNQILNMLEASYVAYTPWKITWASAKAKLSIALDEIDSSYDPDDEAYNIELGQEKGEQLLNAIQSTKTAEPASHLLNINALHSTEPSSTSTDTDTDSSKMDSQSVRVLFRSPNSPSRKKKKKLTQKFNERHYWNIMLDEYTNTLLYYQDLCNKQTYNMSMHELYSYGILLKTICNEVLSISRLLYTEQSKARGDAEYISLIYNIHQDTKDPYKRLQYITDWEQNGSIQANWGDGLANTYKDHNGTMFSVPCTSIILPGQPEGAELLWQDYTQGKLTLLAFYTNYIKLLQQDVERIMDEGYDNLILEPPAWSIDVREHAANKDNNNTTTDGHNSTTISQQSNWLHEQTTRFKQIEEMMSRGDVSQDVIDAMIDSLHTEQEEKRRQNGTLQSTHINTGQLSDNPLQSYLDQRVAQHAPPVSPDDDPDDLLYSPIRRKQVKRMKEESKRKYPVAPNKADPSMAEMKLVERASQKALAQTKRKNSQLYNDNDDVYDIYDNTNSSYTFTDDEYKALSLLVDNNDDNIINTKHTQITSGKRNKKGSYDLDMASTSPDFYRNVTESLSKKH